MAATGRRTRWGLLLLGLILAGLSAAWFLTPLSTMVVDAVSGGGGAASKMSTSARGARPADTSTWDMLKTALDAANAFFGAAGFLMALRGMRGQKQQQ